MGKILVIAEKPSVAKNYAKSLGQAYMKDGYYEGDKYVITWSVGHIISRKELYEYDSNINRAFQNREHVLSTIPYFPDKHILKLALINTEWIKDKTKLEFAKRNNSGLKEREKVIKALFARDDIDFIVNGCDAGREGEAIFCQIYDFFNCTFPMKRLWLSSSTEDAVREAFRNLKDGRDYYNLKQSSYARAEVDWEHGLNLSVLYASLYQTDLTVGRVQTPVVNMIVEREKEIRNFKSEDYFLLDGHFSTTDGFKYIGRLVINKSLEEFTVDGKIKELSKINKIISDVENKQGIIKSIDKKKKKETPKLLFNITGIQKEMNGKYKITAQETLNAAQSLYEKHKITTYPRTNSEYLNENMRDSVFQILDCLPKEFASAVDVAKKSGCFFEKILNDKEVEDHYALIPTENAKNFDISVLSVNEKRVFLAIVKRFLSLFLPNHEYESTVLTTKVEDYEFKTTGKKILVMGWKSLYTSEKAEDDDKKEDEDTQDLTYDFKEGATVLTEKAEKLAKKTQAPSRFTEKTLLGAMEVGGTKNANIDDREMLKILKAKGLGTGATRAGIIESVVNRNYVERKSGSLVPTDKGMEFIDKVKIDVIKSPEITGEWEYKLGLVEKGELSKDEFTNGVRNFIRDCVEKTKDSYTVGDTISSGNSIDAVCPVCGKQILKSAKGYYCSNRAECKFYMPSTVMSKSLKESDIISLCTDGETKLIKGFTSSKKDENGKPVKFDAIIFYNKEEMKPQFKFAGNNTPKEKHETEYICPECGKPILEYDKNYSCSGYVDGCKFSFFKELGGKKLTDKIIKGLLQTGESEVLIGLVNPKYPDRKYNAKIVIENGVTTVKYVNENGEENVSKASKYFCPCCKKPILDKDTYFKCSNGKCGFFVGKKYAGTVLPEKALDEVFQNKETSDFYNFTSNAGNPFKAKLKVNKKTKKIEFEFENKKK